MTHSGYSNAVIATVEDYLGQLDTLATAINSQRNIEGSTLLPELRREYRRFLFRQEYGFGNINYHLPSCHG